MIGQREIHDLKHFIESFNSEDGAFKTHDGALIEDLKSQIGLKNSRIEFLEKKVELLEEQGL